MIEEKCLAGEKYLASFVDGKKVIYITTKESSYIRNAQWKKLIETYSERMTFISSQKKNYVQRVLKAYIYGAKELVKKENDIIVVGFSPQLLMPLLWLYKKTGRKIGIDFFISMYDTFICDRKKFKKDSIISRILYWIDCQTLKYTDFVIADTKEHFKYFCSEFHVPESKGIIWYLVADETLYYPMKDLEKHRQNQEVFSVLYFGSVLPLQGVDIVLKSMQYLKQYQEIKFVMIGPLNQKKHINKADYPNTVFYEWLSQEELAGKIAKADLCLAGHFNNDIEKAKRTIAGKTYIYKAMEKPVVLGENPANRELFSEKVLENYFVPMGDAKALAKIILKARKDLEGKR